MTEATQGNIVFTEIPATDPKRACKFYETLLEAPLTKDDNGPNPIWMFPHSEGASSSGHLYPGAPAKEGEGMTAHFGITGELNDAMERVKMGAAKSFPK